MPTYGYHCSACKKELEIFQKITEEALTLCPNCKEEALHRGPGGGIGLSFTGTGFYITDYPKGDKPAHKHSSGCGCKGE